MSNQFKSCLQRTYCWSGSHLDDGAIDFIISLKRFPQVEYAHNHLSSIFSLYCMQSLSHGSCYIFICVLYTRCNKFYGTSIALGQICKKKFLYKNLFSHIFNENPCIINWMGLEISCAFLVLRCQRKLLPVLFSVLTRV